jgi:multidrug resistance efflux pump
MAKRAIVIPLIILVVAVLFLVIDGKWTARSSSRAEQETDDAYVQADMTPLSTRISGTARTMKVNDFDSVKASQVLVEIDDDQYRAVVKEAKAALAASQAALEENQAAKRIQEAKIQTAEAMVGEAETAVSTARAGIASTQPDVERTAIERKRQEAASGLPGSLCHALFDERHDELRPCESLFGAAMADVGSARSVKRLDSLWAHHGFPVCDSSESLVISMAVQIEY